MDDMEDKSNSGETVFVVDGKRMTETEYSALKIRQSSKTKDKGMEGVTNE